jgi:hypothetical protein
MGGGGPPCRLILADIISGILDRETTTVNGD